MVIPHLKEHDIGITLVGIFNFELIAGVERARPIVGEFAIINEFDVPAARTRQEDGLAIGAGYQTSFHTVQFSPLPAAFVNKFQIFIARG